MNTSHLVQVLQTSVSPVVLISGIGLLLLSMTNRLGRVVDRVRELNRTMANHDGERQRSIRRQMRLLFRRSRILRGSIVSSSLSILFVALIILFLFADVLTTFSLGPLIVILFIATIASLIVSLLLFLHDLTLSLKALRLEVGGHI